MGGVQLGTKAHTVHGENHSGRDRASKLERTLYSMLERGLEPESKLITMLFDAYAADKGTRESLLEVGGSDRSPSKEPEVISPRPAPKSTKTPQHPNSPRKGDAKDSPNTKSASKSPTAASPKGHSKESPHAHRDSYRDSISSTKSSATTKAQKKMDTLKALLNTEPVPFMDHEALDAINNAVGSAQVGLIRRDPTLGPRLKGAEQRALDHEEHEMQEEQRKDSERERRAQEEEEKRRLKEQETHEAELLAAEKRAAAQKKAEKLLSYSPPKRKTPHKEVRRVATWR